MQQALHFEVVKWVALCLPAVSGSAACPHVFVGVLLVCPFLALRSHVPLGVPAACLFACLLSSEGWRARIPVIGLWLSIVGLMLRYVLVCAGNDKSNADYLGAADVDICNSAVSVWWVTAVVRDAGSCALCVPTPAQH